MTEICECCALGNCHLGDDFFYGDDEEPSISGGVLVGGARRLRPMGGCTDYYGSALVGGRRRVKGRALVGGCCGNCGAPVSGAGVYRTCTEKGVKNNRKVCLKYTNNPNAPPKLPRRDYQPRRAGPKRANPWVSFLKEESELTGVPYADLLNLKGQNKADLRRIYEQYKSQNGRPVEYI